MDVNFFQNGTAKVGLMIENYKLFEAEIGKDSKCGGFNGGWEQ